MFCDGGLEGFSAYQSVSFQAICRRRIKKPLLFYLFQKFVVSHSEFLKFIKFIKLKVLLLYKPYKLLTFYL